MYLLNDPKLSARQGGVSKKLTEKEATDFLSEQYEKGETKYTPDRSQLGGVGHKLFIDSNTPTGKALLEAEELVKKTKKTSSDHRVAVDFKNVATIDYIAKRSANSPTKEQQEYDNRQPDKIELEKGAGLSEGWRSENAKRRYSGKSEDITAHNDVTGIPWKVTSPGGREDVIVGAKVSDSYGGKERQLTLHKSDGTMSFSPFAKNDKEKENRAKRLVKEITQGKSRNVSIDEINSMIDGSKPDPKPTPNSTGVKGVGGKSVDQQYKDIIAKSKDPKATEEEVSMALMRGLPDFHRDSYNEYSTAIKNNTVPKGYENHYREKVDRFKPVVDNEDFINERRKKAIKGDYETENEARVYVLNKMKEKGYKEHEYYDSPDYEKDYDKLKGVMKTKDVPPPLSGSVPSKDLRKTLNPGDKLFVKSFVSERLSNPSDYRIADGGEVLKVNIKNAKVRSRGISPLNGKPYDVEGVATLNEISHVIRDGKRYKVDDSDRSPNDLGIPESAKPKAGSAREMVGTVKVKIDPKEPAPPTPKLKSKDHAANEKYDQWLISKSQELEGKEKNYNIVTESGKKSVKGKVYENFGIHEERGRYNLTQLSSGRMLNYYDDEDLAKKSIIELNRSGIDWKLNEKELQNIPGIQTKMKSVKRKIGAVIESDKRAKELIESMMRSHEKESWDRSDDLAGYGVKVPKKQKNNFNSNLKLANFAKPGCCCDASKPLKRRKTKQTPRLKRRGNKYA